VNKTSVTLYITIICICTILVSVGFMRFKVVENTDLDKEEMLIETELRQEIANLKEKYNEVLEETDAVNNRIKEYREQIEKNSDSLELVTNELKQTTKLLGKTRVKGDGVVVTLQDTEEEKILESDLSEIINELKYAGAEAISINDIRIETMTDIRQATYDMMLIDGERITSPYVVKVIGNQTYLYSTLTAKNGFIDYYTNNFGLSIGIEKQKNIEIEKSKNDTKLKYIKEGEN